MYDAKHCIERFGTLPCCAVEAQIPPPLIFDFLFFSSSNSSLCGGGL